MLVAVDKFTKWIEAAPVITQDSKSAINFIKSIVFRFGVPHSIIADNGTNFMSKEFKDYCEDWESNCNSAKVVRVGIRSWIDFPPIESSRRIES
jgi:hypothetical protein